MRYIEIDGVRYEVEWCGDCPCHSSGHGMFRNRCNHPKGNFEMRDRRVAFHSKCPLEKMHDCDNCGKLVYFTTKVDFGPGGIEDCDCPEWDRMTDEETELSNEGKCPYWVPREVEE